MSRRSRNRRKSIRRQVLTKREQRYLDKLSQRQGDDRPRDSRSVKVW